MPSYPHDAACATSGLPPHTWDETVAGETETQRKARIATAKNVCRSCPVADACLRRLVDGGGVRAGKVYADSVPGYRGDWYLPITEHAAVTGCGTNAGYNAHRSTGTPTCAPCKAAHSSYVQEKKVASRRAAQAAA